MASCTAASRASLRTSGCALPSQPLPPALKVIRFVSAQFHVPVHQPPLAAVVAGSSAPRRRGDDPLPAAKLVGTAAVEFHEVRTSQAPWCGPGDTRGTAGCAPGVATISAAGASVSTCMPSRDASVSSIDSWEGELCPIMLHFGSHTREGTKLKMPQWKNQDAHLVLSFGATRALVAVFDGHGTWGHIIAGHVRKVFVQNAGKLIPLADKPFSNLEEATALRQLFKLAQLSLMRIFDAGGEPLAKFSGTTATVAIVDASKETVAFAHVGDSALMLASDGRLLRKTTDHVVDSMAEKHILARGGEVRTMTITGVTARRVCLQGSDFPGLAMARALGDLVAQDLGVRWEPEVCTGVPFAVGTSLVLASDGVWETTAAETVAGCVEQSKDPQQVAWSLVETSHARWPQGGDIDDITAVVVRFARAVAVARPAARI